MKEKKATTVKIEKHKGEETPKQAENSEKALKKELEDLKEKAKSLEQEAAKWKNEFLIAHADLDNARKRLVKDKEQAVMFANASLIKELLPVLDSFDRALASFGDDPSLKGMADGVRIVRQQFFEVLKGNGLEKISSAPGDEFDPSEHEACEFEVSPEAKKETVAKEFETGYKLHGRVLRSAKVKVLKPEI